VSEHCSGRGKEKKEKKEKNEGEPMAEKGLIWPSVLVFLKVRARGNTSTFSALPSFPSPITSRASSGPPPYLCRQASKNEEERRRGQRGGGGGGDDGRGDGDGESTKSRDEEKKNVIST
jgi:hypothetical protein